MNDLDLDARDGQQRDWQALGDAWRGQDAGTIDLATVRRQARWRGRRLWLALLLESLLTLVALAFCVALVVRADTAAPARLIYLALAAVLLGYQGWVWWIRRRQLRDSGLGAAALLVLEIERARSSLRYWRVGTWASLLLWVGLSVLTAHLWRIAAAGDGPGTTWLLANLLINASVVLAWACIAWWKGRHNLARIARLQRMRVEIDAD